MRRLTKAAAPSVLQSNAVEWTEEYVDLSGVGGAVLPTRWRNPEIQAALRLETSDKCAYCESQVESVTWFHIEHIRPKAKFPELVVEWGNLTLACPRCNQYKADYYDEEHSLLHPYEDDPEAHLQFVGGFVRPRDGSPRGEVTIKRLRLHRAGLVQQRMQKIDNIERLVQAWHKAPAHLRDVLQEQVWEEAGVDGEFHASATSYLDAINFPR